MLSGLPKRGREVFRREAGNFGMGRIVNDEKLLWARKGPSPNKFGGKGVEATPR